MKTHYQLTEKNRRKQGAVHEGAIIAQGIRKTKSEVLSQCTIAGRWGKGGT